MTTTLPETLPAPQRQAVARLLAECGEAAPHPPVAAEAPRTRCWHCGRPGKMGGHHLPGGRIVYVHRRCHRALHAHPAQCTA